MQMFLAEEESKKCNALVRTVRSNLRVMHIVRTVRASTPAIFPETSHYDTYSPYDTYSQYGSYAHVREESKVPVSRGSDIPEELAAADDIVKSWAARHHEVVHKQGGNGTVRMSVQNGNANGSKSENGSKGQGHRRCECVGEREAECVCACTSWVPLGLLPLLCLEPSQAMDAIDQYGTSSFGSPSSSMHPHPTHTAAPSVSEFKRMNWSEVHSVSSPSTPSVMSQTVGKLQPSCIMWLCSMKYWLIWTSY